MSDRALLEAAARAAGIAHTQWAEPGELLKDKGGFVQFIGYGQVAIWNSLTDDGDAFRLAVKLRQMRIHIDAESTAAFRNDIHGVPAIFAGEPHGTDPMAATRLAVTRAAAALSDSGVPASPSRSTLQPPSSASAAIADAARPVQIVEVLPTQIWIEDDIMGGKHIMMQHGSSEPFEFVSLRYSYAYTSNGHIHAMAEEIARDLGAADPIEHRFRPPPSAWMEGKAPKIKGEAGEAK